jgi:hypothetical protein
LGIGDWPNPQSPIPISSYLYINSKNDNVNFNIIFIYSN